MAPALLVVEVGRHNSGPPPPPRPHWRSRGAAPPGTAPRPAADRAAERRYLRLLASSLFLPRPGPGSRKAARFTGRYSGDNRAHFGRVDSQNLRYVRDTRRQRTAESLPESVDLEHLRDRVEAVIRFLDGCSCEFEEIAANQRECK